MSPVHIQRINVLLILKILLATSALVFFAWYGSFQARNFLTGPQIELTAPTNIMQDERTVYLRGNAENITNIELNGRSIHTDEVGNFNEPLVLENGYTIMTLYAEDRYGRTTSLSREFVYYPSS